MSLPEISVIIVNYNSGHRLEKCLKHLSAQSFKDFEVIVLDNASTDQSMEAVKHSELNIKTIMSRENLGFAAGNNEAFKISQGRWLAFLNPDAYAAPDWLEQFMAARQNYPEALAFGSTQIMASDEEMLDGAGDAYHIVGIPYRGNFGWPVSRRPQDCEVFAPCAAAAFYSADIFKQLGGFDVRFFCYGEDVDLGFRLRLIGGEVVQLHRAIVYHEGSAISGRRSDFTVYHGHRNRIWLAYKNTPFWLYWPFLPVHFLADMYLLIRAPGHGTLRPYLRGLIDGYSGLHRFRDSRREIMASRTLPTKDLAKMMTWSVGRLLSRQGKTWQIPK